MPKLALLPALMLIWPLAQGEAATAYRKPGAADLAAIHRWLCPHGGAPVKGVPGRCDRAMDRNPWDNGLPPARREAQAACPEGTRPLLARGHRDVVRCVPE